MKLYQQYKKIPEELKASAWFIVCSILQKAIQFVTIPLFTRLMSTLEYGQYTLYQSWFTLFSIFATLNLSAGVFNNGMIKYEKQRNEYISSMQGLSIFATIVVFGLYVLLKPLISDLVGLPNIVMVVMFFQILFTPPLSFWSTYQRFQYKYQKLVAVTLMMSVLNPVVGLWMVLSAQDKGVARIFSNALMSVLIGSFFMFYNAAKGKIFFQKQYWIFALKFNVPLIPHYLATVVLGQCDRVMIGRYYGESQVAIYGLAYSLSLVMNIVTTSINSSFIPWTYQQCERGNYQKIGEVSNVLLILIGAVSLIPALLAPELMAILGPEEYAEGAYLVAPISMSVFFTFLYSLFANIEFYFEKSKLIMIASVSGAILNIILNAVCIPLFGYQAAAYTTLVCYMAFSAAHYLFMQRVCREMGITQPIYSLRKIVFMSAALLILSHGVMLTYQTPVVRILLVVTIGVAGFCNRTTLIRQFSALKRKEE